MSRPTAPHIHKFGGASLASAAGVRNAVAIVLAHRPAPQVIVVSAMAGVTDALLDVAARAARGEGGGHVKSTARELRRKHSDAARALMPAGPRRDALLAVIDGAFAEIGRAACRERVQSWADTVSQK